MCRVACGVKGLGDWILDTESGRPLGMSTVRLKLSRRDSLLVEEEVCLSREDEWCLDDRFSRSEECLDEDL